MGDDTVYFVIVNKSTVPVGTATQVERIIRQENPEAPIIVGHPKDNGPAFNWRRGMSLYEGDLSLEQLVAHTTAPLFDLIRW